MSQRRRVRVTEQFFERLDELLPADRSADGLPSATDFLLHELSPTRNVLGGKEVGRGVVLHFHGVKPGSFTTVHCSV